MASFRPSLTISTSASPAPLTVSFLGALQASLSVVLTLFYGFLAARYGLLKDSSARDVSRLCVQLFLPMLIITNIGKELDLNTVGRYGPIMLWSLAYTLISIGYGLVFVKWLEFPAWTSPACSFNNTTSLPLLLTKSLALTGLLDPISKGDTDAAVDRATSYFLMNSMLSNSLTFALGPKLLEDEDDEDETDEEDDDTKDDSLTRADSDSQVILSEDEEEAIGIADQEVNEHTSLIYPVRRAKPSTIKHAKRAQNRLKRFYRRFPQPVQKTLEFVYSMVNAPLVGAAIAVVVGLTPPLHKAMFSPMNKGGVLKAWFTSSLKHVGELFTVLQMFVVGTKLNQSIKQDKKNSHNNGHHDEDDESEASEEEDSVGTRVPKRCLLVIYLLRFAIWPVASILFIRFLAKKHIIHDDPILWFTMMLMPTGPPAIITSSLAELKGNARTKMQVAKLLLISYTVTPIICFAVVGALKTCESLLDAEGR